MTPHNLSTVAPTSHTRPLEGVRVLHVGHHDPAYSRNRLMGRALRSVGATVIDMPDGRRFPQRLPALARAVSRIRPDVVLVGFPGHADVIPARLAGYLQGIPVVFDAFISLYEAEVEDRAHVRPGSVGALRYRLEDVISCRLSDRILLDTEAHMEYFEQRLGVPRHRMRRIWVGADDEYMYPRAVPRANRFQVFFYGSFIPLHGIDTILQAAQLLERDGEDFDLVVVGQGQTFPAHRRLAEELGLTSTRFVGKVPYGQLPDLMAAAHVCLGIFGTTPKAQRVIPNKAFDALAMGRPLVTADTPAAREALRDGEECRLTPPGDPDALADAIRWIRNNQAAAEAMAARGRDRFERSFSLSAVSADVGQIVVEVLDGR